MVVLVTGGLGFIGVNLVSALLDRPGFAIRVLDNGHREPSHPAFSNPRVEFCAGDILDREAVNRATAGTDCIVHLAAASGVVDSLTAPLKSLKVNVEGTLNLLEAARVNRVPRLVFASSNAAVGAHEPPLSETKPTMPLSPYGASKTAGEAFCSAYARSFGVRTVSLRFSNVYGPYSEHKGSVVASFFRQALVGEGLTVHGDGSQTRDFLFVGDLCRAVLLALDRAEAGSVFQIGSGIETPISLLAEKIRGMVASDLKLTVPVRHVAARAGDTSRNYSSIDLAKERLGYIPQVSLDDGLRRTWEWFKLNPTVGDSRAPGVAGS